MAAQPIVRHMVGSIWSPDPITVQARHMVGSIWTADVQPLPAQSGVAAFLALLNNSTSKVTFTTSNLTVGQPQATSLNNVNTVVKITALPASGFSGSMNIYYNRRKITDAVSSNSWLLGTIASNTTILALLSQINTAYGTNFDPTDIVDGPVQAGATSIKLTVANTSYVYIPGASVYLMNQTPLGTATPVTSLGGFDSAAGPVTQLPYATLLMHFDSPQGVAVISDDYGHTPILGARAAISYSQKKFGVGSLPGTTQYGYAGASETVWFADSPDLRLTKDFTLECWAYFISLTDCCLFGKGITGNSAAQAWFEINSGAIAIRPDGATTPTTVATAAQSGITTGVWTHIALTKQGSTWTAWVNGRAVGTMTSTATFGNQAGALSVNGLNYSPSTGSTLPAQSINGYIDEVRVTNGLARYTQTFQPPQAAFKKDYAWGPIANAFPANAVGPIQIGTNGSLTTDLVPQIAAIFGVDLQPNDVVSTQVAAGATSVTLTVASTSLNYTPGSQVTLRVAHTSLLMHFDNSSSLLLDSMGFNTVSSTGTVSQSTASPKFGAGAVSVGTSAIVTVPDSPLFRFTGQDATLEAWVNPSNVTTQNGVLFAKDPASPTVYAELQYYQNTWRLYLDSASFQISATSKMAINTWNHIALVSYKGVWYLYENGQLLGQTTGGTFGNNSNAFQIGNFGGKTANFQGLIDEVRISNVARYTASFTPPQQAFQTNDNIPLASVFPTPINAIIQPTSATTIRALLDAIALNNSVNLVPDDIVDGSVAAGASSIPLVVANTSTTYLPGSQATVPTIMVNKTVALLHFDGANGQTTTVDAVGHSVTSVGAAALSTTGAKFGSSSLLCPNSPKNYMQIANAAEFQLSGDFTIECWLTPMTSSTNGMVFAKGSAYMRWYNGQLYFVGDSGGGQIIGSNPSWTANTFHHVALVKQAGVYNLYYDGVKVAGPVANTQTFGVSSSPLTIGSDTGGDNSYNGLIDEFRISNVARYTANFTPSNAPFTVD